MNSALKKSFLITLTVCMLLFPIVSVKATIYAVVVGVAKYEDNTGNLLFADDDAVSFYKFLLRATPGKPETNFILLTNQDATRDKIISSLKQQFSKAGDKDKVIFFFSGHGDTDALIPFDGIIEGKELFFDEIKAAYRNCLADLKLCFVDACFSGNLAKDSREIQKKQVLENHFKSIDKEEIVLFLSSRPDQISREYLPVYKRNHGIFTYFLLDALGGRCDTNRDRLITVNEITKYVIDSVRCETKGEQVPQVKGIIDSDKVIVSYQMK